MGGLEPKSNLVRYDGTTDNKRTAARQHLPDAEEAPCHMRITQKFCHLSGLRARVAKTVEPFWLLAAQRSSLQLVTCCHQNSAHAHSASPETYYDPIGCRWCTSSSLKSSTSGNRTLSQSLYSPPRLVFSFLRHKFFVKRSTTRSS